MSSYTIQHKSVVGVRIRENSRGAKILQFLERFNKIIIQLALVGYEIVRSTISWE